MVLVKHAHMQLATWRS